MKTDTSNINSKISVILIIVFVFSSFNASNNSTFAQTKKTTIDKNQIIGKWIYSKFTNTKTGETENQLKQDNRPYEYTQDGKFYSYDLDQNKIEEKYEINGFYITYTDENNKPRKWIIQKLTNEILIVYPSELPYMIHTYEKIITEPTLLIDTAAIYGIWQQYRWFDKFTDNVQDGLLYSIDDSPKVTIYQKNGNIYNGTLKHNSHVGNFRLENNKLIQNYFDDRENSIIIIKLTKDEFIYRIDKGDVFSFFKIKK